MNSLIRGSVARRVMSNGVQMPAWRKAVTVARPAPLKWTRTFADAALLSSSEVTDRIMQVVRNFDKVEPGLVTEKAHFTKDLKLDSLDVVEVVMAFEEEFSIEIPDAECEKIFTVEDAVKFVSTHPQAK